MEAINKRASSAKALVPVVALIAVAVCIQAASIPVLPGFIHPNDSQSYLMTAQSLRSHRAFVNDQGGPDTFRTPGYPAALAMLFALGLHVPGVILLQHLIVTLLVGATAAVFSRVGHNRVAAAAAGLFLATDLATMQLANWVMTEILATLLVCATAVCAYRAVSKCSMQAAAACGMMSGVATLVRPVGVLLGAVLAAVVFVRSNAPRPRRTFASVLLLITSLALPGLWVARNYVETGHAMLSSVGGLNLLEYRAAGVLATHDRGDFEANRVRHRNELLSTACAQIERDFGRNCSDIPLTDRAAVYSRVANEIILRDPAGYAKSAARGAAMILLGDSAASLASAAHISSRAAKLICLGITVPMCALAALGTIWLWKADRTLTWLLVGIVAYFVVISAGPEGDSRFRVVFMPCYSMLAGGGVAAVYERLRTIKTREQEQATAAANS